jgi:cytochrome c biogenesis protein
MEGLDMTVELRGFSEYTLLIAKRDPGAAIVWAAFLALLAGLAVTFYLPRRRVWARLGRDGRLDLVGRSDRQVDFDREFGSLVDAIVGARAGPAAERGAAAGSAG